MSTRQSLVRLIVCLGLMMGLTPPVAAAPPRAPSATCTVDEDGGADYTTIQDAVDDAACDTISVAAGDYEENIVIARSLTLTGAGAAGTWVGGRGQVFLIDSESAVVAISGVTIEGVFHSGNGTGVYNSGVLTLTSVIVANNEGDMGAGIYNEGTLTVVDSTIVGNMALWGTGAGIYNAGEITILDSEIKGNYAELGGGVYNAYGNQAAIQNSMIEDNQASHAGGIYNGGDLTIGNSQILNNIAAGEEYSYGGGIYNNYNAAELTIADSVIQGNSAEYFGGGIYLANDAEMWLIGCTVNDNSANDGGGIYSSASGSYVSIVDSEISANMVSSSGGGLYSGDVMLVENSSIFNNTASDNGGGIQVGSAGTLNLTNVTVSGNTAGDNGGGIAAWGSVYLNSATIAYNTADANADDDGDGGGVYASGAATVTNTLIGANDDNSPATAHPDCSGSFTSLGYNLVRNANGCSGFTATGDLTGSALSPLEPYLLALDAYGGWTPTHALHYGHLYKSPAIDAGSPTACPATDQRGVPRPADGDKDGAAVCDIGAFELTQDEPTDLTLTKTASSAAVRPGDAVTFTLTFANAGPLTASGVRITDTVPVQIESLSYLASGAVITEVVGAPYAWEVADLEIGAQGIITITGVLSDALEAGASIVNTAVITTTNPDLTPADNSSTASVSVAACFATPNDGATVYMSGDAQAVRDAVNAASAGDVVKIAGICAGSDAAKVVYIAKNLTLRGGYADDDWSVADPNNPATLDAQGDGSVVYVDNSVVTLENLNLTGGAGSYGGGVYAQSSNVALNRVNIYDNVANYRGGGVYVRDSGVVMTETLIFNNTAVHGGGVYIRDGNVTLNATHVMSNTARDYGGGLLVSDYDSSYHADVTLVGVTVLNNTAGTYGGGIFVGSGSVTLTETSLVSNTTGAYGGGVYIGDGSAIINATHIYSNVSGLRGGGVHLGCGDAVLNETRVTSNTAGYGGGVYVQGGSAALNTGDIAHNSATDYGGGVYVSSGSATMKDIQITHNSATDYGGGVYVSSGSATMKDIQITHNTAGISGGGVYAYGGSVAIGATHIFSNAAGSSGGGIYVYAGVAVIEESEISSNVSTTSYGGGLYIGTGTVVLSRTRVLSNTAWIGGGMSVGYGQATLERVDIINNTANSYAGGIRITGGSAILRETHVLSNTSGDGGGGINIYTGGSATLNRGAITGNTARYGGGVHNNGSMLALTNVTVGQNEATAYGAGGIYNANGATSVLTFTTIVGNVGTDNGGGLYSAAGTTMMLHNTLVAGNSPSNCNRGVVSAGYNLDDGATCDFTSTGDQQETDPLLDALAENGDTFVYALQPGSPAIDAGLCVTGINVDQRGAPRPFGAACDVGAYESDVPVPPDVTIAKTVAPSSAAPGDPITYTLAFTNTSSVRATGIVITDVVPVGQIADLSYSSNVTVTREPGTWYVWRVQNLAPGAGGLITVTGTLRVPLAAGSFANTAEITARRDANAGNNSSAAYVTVLNVAPTANDATLPPVNETLSLNAPFPASDDNGDALTYAILSGPVSGTVTIAAHRFAYTPTNQTASYTDTFTYIVTDTGGLTDTAAIAIPVTANDDPPTISNIPNQRTDPGVTVGPIAFTVDDVDTPVAALALDKATSDAALAPLANITFGGSAANRTVTITPTTGTGTALITVTVSDGHSSSYDVFALTVGASVNSPPEFTSAPVTEATQDVVYTYAITAADLDPGDTLTIVATLKPGWLTLTDHGDGTATLTGTPGNANVGDHSVKLQVTDNAGAAEVQAFVISVANVNDAPIAQDDFASTNEVTPKTIPVLDNDDNDPDGDEVFLVAVGAPLYGATAIHTSFVIYTPTNRAASYTDTFTYTISDGALTDTANVTVTVAAIDDPPTISDIPNLQTRQGVSTGPLSFTVNDPDTPVDSLTLARASSNPLLAPLANITFGGSGNARTVTITPTAELSGSAFITVTVSDGHPATAASDSFVLDVIPNNAPLFVTVPITEASEDLEYIYSIIAVDADDDALTIIAPTRPLWLHLVHYGDGMATLTGVPLQADVGEHPVVLRVVDSFGALATQAFTITVAAVNDPPLARDDVATTDEHTPRGIPVLANDSDPDSELFIAEVSPPLYGSAVISKSAAGDDIVIYMPVNRTTSYTDTFDYIASDGELMDSATVSVTVTAVDDPPFISNVRNQRTDADTPVTIPFAVNDPDTPLDTLVLDNLSSDEGLVPLENITFEGNGIERTVTITPTAGLSGTVVITLTVNDGTTLVADSFVLAVAANSPPEFTSTPPTEVSEGVFYVYRIIAVDVETNTLTITAPVSPTWLTLYDYHNGRATLVGKPLQEDVGNHEVTLRVEDDAGGSNTQSFVITVHDVLHRPRAVNDNVATDEDTPVSVAVLSNDVDLDGDPLTLIAWGQPQVGVAACDVLLATCTYTPANRISDYTVAFTYTISDGMFTAEAAVWVDVTADDDPPEITAIDDQHTDPGVPAGPIPFVVGDPDTPLHTLLLDKASSNTILVPVENITLGGEGGHRTVTVTPTLGNGAAVITISVSDGSSVAYAAFALTVGANNPPEFTSTPKITATAGTLYTDTVIVDDADPADVLTITATTLPGWLTLTQHLSRTAILAGLPPAVGAYPVVLHVTDGADNATQSFTITVELSPVNRLPEANAGPDQLVAPNAVVTLDGSASTDPDGDALVYFWQQTGGQSVSLSHTGVISPTFVAPSSGGILTFTLTITDTGGLADTDEVVITIAQHLIFLPLVVRNN